MENNNQDTTQKNKRGLKPAIKVILLILIVILSFSSGFSFGKKGYKFVPKTFSVINQNNSSQTVDYNLLWESISKLNEKFIDKPVDPQKVLYGAVKGAMASSNDPYTDFFTPKELEDFKTDLSGSFFGIGAEVGRQNGNIIIIAPLDGAPAQKAGLMAKDIIYKVNGEVTANWSVEQTVEKIRGPQGTSVTLTVVRDSRLKPFDITIVRDKINLKSVKLNFKDITVSGAKKKVAVLDISRFGDDTKDLVDQAVTEILKNNVAGVVVDLRNNPGGYLETSVDVASNWLENGKLVVSEAHSDGSSIKYNAKGLNRLAGIKTVVLINGGSASAAEILAGALHDHKVAQLIGEKSFGKGSVQELFNLTGGSAVKITIAKWITPGGVNLNHNGLDPDIKVELTEDDFAKNKDPQMEKALEEITK